MLLVTKATSPITPQHRPRRMGPGSRSRSLSSGARSRDPLARLSGKTASEYSNTQLRAGHQDIAADLAGAGGEFIAQAPRRGGVAFQHALKQAARDPDHGRTFQRNRAGGPPHRDHERKLADQRTRSGDDFGAGAVIDPERAALDDETGIGIVAGVEEHVAMFEVALFGADRQHAQAGRSQQTQGRDALQQRYIIFDRHAGPLIGMREY